MDTLPKRKSIRIKEYDYSEPGAYFITVCTANREKIFWDDRRGELRSPANIPLSDIGLIADNEIKKLNTVYDAVRVDTYCIMPDHIHLILRIESGTCGRMVSASTETERDRAGQDKNDTCCTGHGLPPGGAPSGRTQFAPTISRVIKQFKGSITKQTGRSVWQKSFYDHGIRNQQDYQEIWTYIENNPRKYLLGKNREESL